MPQIYLQQTDGARIPLTVDDNGHLVLSSSGPLSITGGIDSRIYTYNGSTWERTRMDSATHTLQIIEYEHHEIHSGSSFVSDAESTLSIGGTIKLTFKTPDTTRWAHMVVSARGSAESNVQIIEGANVTDNTGAANPVYNRDRNSANTSTLIDTSTNPDTAGQITLGATTGAGGTVIYEEHFGSGNVVGGDTRAQEEFVLKQNTQYAIVFTSEGNSNDAEVILNWYEHVNK